MLNPELESSEHRVRDVFVVHIIEKAAGEREDRVGGVRGAVVGVGALVAADAFEHQLRVAREGLSEVELEAELVGVAVRFVLRAGVGLKVQGPGVAKGV